MNALIKIQEVVKSGYGGVLPNGNIVDRRKFPAAIPIVKNSVLVVPKPKNTRHSDIIAGFITCAVISLFVWLIWYR